MLHPNTQQSNLYNTLIVTQSVCAMTMCIWGCIAETDQMERK